MLFPRRPFLPCVLILLAACSSTGSSPDGAPGARADARVLQTDGGLSDSGVDPDCAARLGADDGCDCGCGFDSDCPIFATAGDCVREHCAAGQNLDSDDVFRCIPDAPPGWLCPSFAYGGDFACTCGCGALDDIDCGADLTLEDCAVEHGCPGGSAPDPDDPTRCAPFPVEWTCDWNRYYDADECACGCGLPGPGCPSSAHVSDCEFDGCDYGMSPDPVDLDSCIDEAPQDNWDCDIALLYDGSICDCGCGAIDPDCPGGAIDSDCDVIHCGAGDELADDDIGTCWEICDYDPNPVGSATCTNGGSISIFNSCVESLSACSDGHTYEVECTAGQCVCRVDGQCTHHATGGCSLNFTCGWSLVDAT